MFGKTLEYRVRRGERFVKRRPGNWVRKYVLNKEYDKYILEAPSTELLRSKENLDVVIDPSQVSRPVRKRKHYIPTEDIKQNVKLRKFGKLDYLVGWLNQC